MEHVLVDELEPGILLVTLNRPERLNALSQGLIAELHTTFDEIGRARDARVVILTGTGPGFCAGADLKGSKASTAPPGPRRWATWPASS